MTSGRAASKRSAAAAVASTAPGLARILEMSVSNCREHDLSLRQLAVLERVDQHETTPGEVARALSVTPAVVTGLIDRMERRGYVRRSESPIDRRRVQIELTDSGDDVRECALSGIIGTLESMFEDFTDEDLDAIERGMRLLHSVLGRASVSEHTTTGRA